MKGGASAPLLLMSHKDKTGYDTREQATNIAQRMAHQTGNPIWVYHRDDKWFVSGCVNLYGHCPSMPTPKEFRRVHKKFTYWKRATIPRVYYITYDVGSFKMLIDNIIQPVTYNFVLGLLRTGAMLIISRSPNSLTARDFTYEVREKVRLAVIYRTVGDRTFVLRAGHNVHELNNQMYNAWLVYTGLLTPPQGISRGNNGKNTRGESQRKGRRYPRKRLRLYHNTNNRRVR